MSFQGISRAERDADVPLAIFYERTAGDSTRITSADLLRTANLLPQTIKHIINFYRGKNMIWLVLFAMDAFIVFLRRPVKS